MKGQCEGPYIHSMDCDFQIFIIKRGEGTITLKTTDYIVQSSTKLCEDIASPVSVQREGCMWWISQEASGRWIPGPKGKYALERQEMCVLVKEMVPITAVIATFSGTCCVVDTCLHTSTHLTSTAVSLPV